MTARSSTPLRAAGAVLAALVAVLGLGGARPAAAKGHTIVAHFPSAISLYARGSVRVLGIQVGRVKSVKLEQDEVVVTMDVGDVPMPEGVEAVIMPSSLIGERYVQLVPAWQAGQPQAAPDADGVIDIPRARTDVPTEPDEALAALKHLLDSLNPDATGRLIHNLGDDLDGQGANLNSALKGLSQLTQTLADKDTQIADIVDHVDQLTTVLHTRESQLGSIIDSFNQVAGILADERGRLQTLVTNLANTSVDAYTLIHSNKANLEEDLSTLSRALDAVGANLDSVKLLLQTGPYIVAGRDLDGKTEGLLAAYNPKYHETDLRTALSPLVNGTLGNILRGLGLQNIPVTCLPVDVTCASGAAAGTAAKAPAAATPPTTAAPKAPTTTAPKGPIDSILGLLGTGTVSGQAVGSAIPVAAPAQPGWAHRLAHSIVGALS